MPIIRPPARSWASVAFRTSIFLCSVVSADIATLGAAAAQQVSHPVVLADADLDLVTAGAVFAAVTANAQARGADVVATTKTGARAVAGEPGRVEKGIANANGSARARVSAGSTTTAGENVAFASSDGLATSIHVVTDAKGDGNKTTSWSKTRTEARDGAKRDAAFGLGRSHSTGDNPEASADVQFLTFGKQKRSNTWTRTRKLSNGTVTVTVERAVYVADDGSITRTWKMIRNVDKADAASAIARGRIVTVQPAAVRR